MTETRFDLEPMAELFEQGGLPSHLAPLWFAQVLRDAFDLTAAGGTATFAEVGRPYSSSSRCTPTRSRRSADERTAPAPRRSARRPAATGRRRDLLAFSNGSTAVAEALLTTAQVRDCFHQLLSVDDDGAWDPAARPYQYAAERWDLSPSELMLVAVHPWDIDGAARTGLQKAWSNRTGNPYPSLFVSPD